MQGAQFIKVRQHYNAATYLLWSSVRSIIFASRPVPGLVSRKRAGVVFGTCSAMSTCQKLS